MTNEQMYILIGVPGILALVGILVNSVLVAHVSTTLNARMTAVETRIGSLENTFTTRFDLLMGRLLRLMGKVSRGRF